MGWIFGRRKRIAKGTTLYVGKRGATVSKKVGKRVTVNSKGRATVRLGKGLRFKI